MANIQRRRRVEEQIQRELSEIIRLELRDPAVGLITITGVEVSPDLAHAKVFFTRMGAAEEQSAAIAGLKRASVFLRSLLGRRIRLHSTPSLNFIFDQSVERGIRLSGLIDEAVRSNGKSDLPGDEGSGA
jgi:ribosome-binding factor A